MPRSYHTDAKMNYWWPVQKNAKFPSPKTLAVIALGPIDNIKIIVMVVLHLITGKHRQSLFFKKSLQDSRSSDTNGPSKRRPKWHNDHLCRSDPPSLNTSSSFSTDTLYSCFVLTQKPQWCSAIMWHWPVQKSICEVCDLVHYLSPWSCDG